MARFTIVNTDENPGRYIGQSAEGETSSCFGIDTIEGEPVFILRAQDELAFRAIMAWISLAIDSNVNPTKIQKALNQLSHFSRWELTHSKRMKLPD